MLPSTRAPPFASHPSSNAGSNGEPIETTHDVFRRLVEPAEAADADDTTGVRHTVEGFETLLAGHEAVFEALDGG